MHYLGYALPRRKNLSHYIILLRTTMTELVNYLSLDSSPPCTQPASRDFSPSYRSQPLLLKVNIIITMKIVAAILTAAAATTTVANGSSLKDPKTVVQKENERGLTESERRLAVSVVLVSFVGRMYASSFISLS